MPYLAPSIISSSASSTPSIPASKRSPASSDTPSPQELPSYPTRLGRPDTANTFIQSEAPVSAFGRPDTAGTFDGRAYDWVSGVSPREAVDSSSRSDWDSSGYDVGPPTEGPQPVSAPMKSSTATPTFGYASRRAPSQTGTDQTPPFGYASRPAPASRGGADQPTSLTGLALDSPFGLGRPDTAGTFFGHDSSHEDDETPQSSTPTAEVEDPRPATSSRHSSGSYRKPIPTYLASPISNGALPSSHPFAQVADLKRAASQKVSVGSVGSTQSDSVLVRNGLPPPRRPNGHVSTLSRTEPLAPSAAADTSSIEDTESSSRRRRKSAYNPHLPIEQQIAIPARISSVPRSPLQDRPLPPIPMMTPEWSRPGLQISPTSDVSSAGPTTPVLGRPLSLGPASHVVIAEQPEVTPPMSDAGDEDEEDDQTFTVDRIPNKRRIAEAAECSVIDEEGRSIRFGDFFPAGSDRVSGEDAEYPPITKTVAFFIRTFW